MQQTTKTVKIGIAGLGTVGSGVAQLLKQNRAMILKKTGLNIELNAVLDIQLAGKENLIPKTCIATDDIERFFSIPRDITIELVGGKEIANTILERALMAGQHVVTANKALLAEKGQNLFGLAQEKGLQIKYEAAVAGAIPIIQVLENSLLQNNISKIDGILNGTSNYILTRMYEERLTYADVLPQAQELGYAEADPTFDVDGYDAAHKIAILANLAFDSHIPFNDIYIQGIRNINLIDMDIADKMGYLIKPLAIAKWNQDQIEVRVHPTMIPKSHPLASLRLENNGVFYQTDFSGPGSLFGKGAGGNPTGSAVISDVIQIGLNNQSPLKFNIQKTKSIANLKDIDSRFYIRLMTKDKPGILSTISGILGEKNISIASVVQLEGKQNSVPLTMTTHKANAQKMKEALETIEKLPEISGETSLLYIEEPDQ